MKDKGLVIWCIMMIVMGTPIFFISIPKVFTGEDIASIRAQLDILYMQAFGRCVVTCHVFLLFNVLWIQYEKRIRLFLSSKSSEIVKFLESK